MMREWEASNKPRKPRPAPLDLDEHEDEVVAQWSPSHMMANGDGLLSPMGGGFSPSAAATTAAGRSPRSFAFDFEDPHAVAPPPEDASWRAAGAASFAGHNCTTATSKQDHAVEDTEREEVKDGQEDPSWGPSWSSILEQLTPRALEQQLPSTPHMPNAPLFEQPTPMNEDHRIRKRKAGAKMERAMSLGSDNDSSHSDSSGPTGLPACGSDENSRHWGNHQRHNSSGSALMEVQLESVHVKEEPDMHLEQRSMKRAKSSPLMIKQGMPVDGAFRQQHPLHDFATHDRAEPLVKLEPSGYPSHHRQGMGPRRASATAAPGGRGFGEAGMALPLGAQPLQPYQPGYHHQQAQHFAHLQRLQRERFHGRTDGGRLSLDAISPAGHSYVPSEKALLAAGATKLAGKRWTARQDEQLRAAVDKYNGSNWKAIAGHVEGRNHVQCLQRWKKVLQPGLIKGMWSQEEDDLLVMYMNKYGCESGWTKIAERIPGRTAKQCRERWHLNLDPSINRGPWTKHEDSVLLTLHARVGNKWAEIKRSLPGRTENGVKSRYKSIVRAQRRKPRLSL